MDVAALDSTGIRDACGEAGTLEVKAWSIWPKLKNLGDANGFEVG